jgi:hypothetical protein
LTNKEDKRSRHDPAVGVCLRWTPGETVEVPDGAWVRFGADAAVKFFTPLRLFNYLRIYRTSVGAG